MRKQMIFRIRIIAIGLIVLSVALISRLYYVQVHAHEIYTDRAARQYVQAIQDLYTRGSIFFTTKDQKHVSAASIKQGHVLALNPSIITSAESVCTAITPLLQSSYDRCVERAALPNRTYVELETRVELEVAEAIRALNLPGVQLYRNQWRYYPGGSLTARTLGFVGYTEKSDTELHGKYGLERYYDSTLFRAREGKNVNLFAELFSNLGADTSVEPEHAVGDIILTIEPTVANMLDTVLLETQEKYGSEVSGAIIMDPKTGAIYAMSMVPGFDLNTRDGATVDDFQNPLVENVYEFGSTIKALTVAAGLDSQAITRRSTFYDEGCIELNTKKICNYDGRGRGTVDMQEVLNQSLNTGVSYIVQKMGRDRFRDYFKNFRLGSETGIDLPNEVSGLTNNLDSPRDVEYATASFGQGIAMTPIAAARALATLGNGGYLVTPHLVSSIRQSDGSYREVRYPRGAQVLRPETSEEISRILTGVVDEALLNGTVALPRHTIAAKTGTAQIANPDGGGYHEDEFLHSFFGYFPAYDPKFLVFMYTVNPQGVRFASETLTLPFMDVAKFLINYYSVPPDR